MFKKEMSELLAMGENFVKAFESVAKATVDETDKQVAIIRQAKASLVQTKETQGEFVKVAIMIANAMDDFMEMVNESEDTASVVIEAVEDMESQIFDSEDDDYEEEEEEEEEDSNIPDGYYEDEEDDEEDHEEEDESNE